MILYFQVQFLKQKRFENVKSTIKNALKSERKNKISQKKISPRTRKKCKELKGDIETQSQDDSIYKGNIRKILNKKKNIKKKISGKSLKTKPNKK